MTTTAKPPRQRKVTCTRCDYAWTPRKAPPARAPRYRCPACFRLVRPAEARKYQETAATRTA